MPNFSLGGREEVVVCLRGGPFFGEELMYPLPSFEAERIMELKASRLVERGPEPEFDALAQIAQAALNTPICLVTLIDEKRQWFKANVGLDVRETPREHAFCN